MEKCSTAKFAQTINSIPMKIVKIEGMVGKNCAYQKIASINTVSATLQLEINLW